MVNSNSTYFIHPPASQQQHLVAGSNQNLACKTSSQQSLQFLAIAGPWQQIQQTQPAQLHHQHNHHSHHHNNNGCSSTISGGSCNQLPQQSSVCISSSSLLSKSQQSLNQTGSSSSSSSSCLDSTSSQLLKTTNLLANLDWCSDVVKKQEDGGGGGGGGSTIIGDGNGNSTSVTRPIGSMENISIKDFVPVTFNYSTSQGSNKSIANSSGISSAGTTSTNGSKHHHLLASSSQSSGVLMGSSASGSSLNLNSSSSIVGHNLVLSDLDSSDDNHLSFSKNGTEIFDYDCDYDNEEEFKYLARAAAAVAAGGTSSSNATNATCTSGGTNAAGSAAVPSSVGSVSTGPSNTSSGSSNNSSSKNRVSFDANINDYLRVPPIGLGEFDLDGGGLLKTRRSNSLTTGMVSSACGLSVGQLHQQKQNNECLSAENLSNLQLLQNKPRSFSLTMDSPRSSLTSSGSETRLDDFKQHHMMKIYGSPNVGMSSIAHWLKSLRLHKYVWLFSNLTYEQMMEMSEEYLANLGVTKGARHKLVLCIHKLKERYSVLLRLEKDILNAGGSRTQLGPVFDELTNMVLTPMKPIGLDQKEDIAGMFVKLLDLIASVTLTRPLCGPQEEECINVFIWVLERALHNDAFAVQFVQIKEYKYKANKLKMAYAPKGHYAKNNNLNGNLNKPRWSATIKHKPNNATDGQKTPHRKSSLQYFTPPMQQSQSSQQQSQQPQQQSQQQNSSSTHLQAIPHQYYGHGGHNPNAGTGHNNSYNKSSSYPNFASNLSSSSNSSGNNSIMKPHHVQHLQQGQGPHSLSQQSQQPQQTHHAQQQQQSHVPPHGNFMYHRHSLNNISAHQHQQQFLQQLQNQQQQQQQHQQLPVLPSIFLTAMGGGPPPQNKGKSQSSETPCLNPKVATTVPPPKTSPVDLLGSKGQNNSIGDINSRLEFLCLQMTEQAIN